MARFQASNRKAGLTRLELATSGVTDRHSNLLSYSPFPGALGPDTFVVWPTRLAAPSYAPAGNRTPSATLKEWSPDR